MNFCTESLGTKIAIVNRVAEEGYEVTNLMRSNASTGSSLNPEGVGFMASSFVRPPVTVRLDFPSPIHVSHIVIGTKLGQQISSGFKIEVNINSHQDDSVGQDTRLYQIARELLQGPTFPPVVVFRNPRFVLHRKYCHLSLSDFEIYRHHPQAYGLRHPTYNSCERIFSLYLTIEKAKSPARIPVLGSLQVWGQPSKWSTLTEVHQLLTSWTETAQTSNTRHKIPNTGEVPSEPEPKRLKLAASETEIPDDFLDPITFDIMCLPIRLPCGVAVDSKTLERYSKEESKWGRLDNDPFTGKIFSEDSGPLPDLALKSRIDSFLTQHCNSVQAPRTLGTRVKPQELYSSRISGPPTGPVSSSPSTTTSTSTTTLQYIPASALTPQQLMDQELARILDGSSFKPPARFEAVAKCFQCSTSVRSRKQGDGQSFYKSSCDHVIACRTCLIRLDRTERNQCTQCKSPWSANSLVKICV